MSGVTVRRDIFCELWHSGAKFHATKVLSITLPKIKNNQSDVALIGERIPLTGF